MTDTRQKPGRRAWAPNTRLVAFYITPEAEQILRDEVHRTELTQSEIVDRAIRATRQPTRQAC